MKIYLLVFFTLFGHLLYAGTIKVSVLGEDQYRNANCVWTVEYTKFSETQIVFRITGVDNKSTAKDGAPHDWSLQLFGGKQIEYSWRDDVNGWVAPVPCAYSFIGKVDGIFGEGVVGIVGGIPKPPKNVVQRVKNDYPFPIWVTLNTPKGIITKMIPPGGDFLFSVPGLDPGDVVSVAVTAPGYDFGSSGELVPTPGGTAFLGVGSWTVDGPEGQDFTPYSSPSVSANFGSKFIATAVPGSDTSMRTYDAQGNYTGTLTGDHLTSAAYSNGVSNIVGAISTVGGKIDQVSKVVADSAEASKKANAVVEKFGKNYDSLEKYSAADSLSTAMGEAKSVAEYSGLNTKIGHRKESTTGLSGGSDSLPTLHVGTTALVFSFSPTIGGVGSILNVCRPILLAACLIGFMRSISTHVTAYTAALPTVAGQDSSVGLENFVPGVPQAKTLVTASAAVAIIFGAAAALIALADSILTYYGSGAVAVFGVINFPGGIAYSVIDRFMPLGPMVSLVILEACVPYLLAPIYLAAASILKFVKA